MVGLSEGNPCPPSFIMISGEAVWQPIQKYFLGGKLLVSFFVILI